LETIFSHFWVTFILYNTSLGCLIMPFFSQYLWNTKFIKMTPFAARLIMALRNFWVTLRFRTKVTLAFSNQPHDFSKKKFCLSHDFFFFVFFSNTLKKTTFQVKFEIQKIQNENLLFILFFPSRSNVFAFVVSIFLCVWEMLSRSKMIKWRRSNHNSRQYDENVHTKDQDQLPWFV